MFKVGDKVKFIKRTNSHTSSVKIGGVYTIEYIDYTDDTTPYQIKENGEWFKEDELELVKTAQFTKSDLKDGDIVTYRGGEKRIVQEERLIKMDGNNGYNLNGYRDDLTEKAGCVDLDIIKVERPKYETVFERKEEILDEAEKRYLRDVIRPFRDDIRYVEKKRTTASELYIKAVMKYNNDYLSFPYLKNTKMYKGMKANKEYTLEELRTIKE